MRCRSLRLRFADDGKTAGSVTTPAPPPPPPPPAVDSPGSIGASDMTTRSELLCYYSVSLCCCAGAGVSVGLDGMMHELDPTRILRAVP